MDVYGAGELRSLAPALGARQTYRLYLSGTGLHRAHEYQHSNWISGTNVITAGVFIYIIIIIASPVVPEDVEGGGPEIRLICVCARGRRTCLPLQCRADMMALFY